MDPIQIPPELFAIAAHPAMPATAEVVLAGRDKLGFPSFRVFPPEGGHAMIDMYFCAALIGVLQRPHIEPLVEAVSFAWEIALEAVRQRPDTKPPTPGENGISQGARGPQPISPA